MELELVGQGNLLSEEQDSGPTNLLYTEHDGCPTVRARVCSRLFKRLKECIFSVEEPMTRDPLFMMTRDSLMTMTRNSHFLMSWDDDLVWDSLLTMTLNSDFTDAIDDTKMSNLQVTNRKTLGFVLVVSFMYQYLMGYLERGRWNRYSNGAQEIHSYCVSVSPAVYLCAKFVETQRRYIGVTKRKRDTKNGSIYKYEPWVRFKKDKFYFEGQNTAEKAAIICDVAKFCLKINGRKGFNFSREQYISLSQFQEFLPQQPDNDIKRLVLLYAQPFLNEVEVSQEVPIVDQPPCVQPARLANGEESDNTSQEFLPSNSDEINNLIQELHGHVDADEQTTNMIREPQSVSPNLEFAGPTIEENVGEGQDVLALSIDPSLNQPRCTSKITLMAPCNCIADISVVEVFQREKWQVAAFKFAASNMSRRCELEGCSEIMHDHICLQKSGNVQELFWSNDMWAVFNHLKKHGWKKVPF